MPENNLDSLEAVFDRYFDDVYGYVAYRLAPDVASAADVAQEVFLAAMRGWASYRGDGNVLSWLRGIARHKVADHLRHCSERERQSFPGTLSELAATGEVGPRQRVLILAQAMRALSSEHVELLEEKYIDGLSVRQMAQTRARTEKAIESALSRARETLRNSFLRLEAKQERRDGHS